MIGQPSAFVQGQGAVTSDALNTFIQGALTVPVLRTLPGLTGMSILLQGSTQPGDGGGGTYYWNSTSVAVDNGATVIAPNGVLMGRWLLFSINPGPSINQPPTGQYFANFGASIDKLNDRVFVGSATLNDGKYPNNNADWLSIFQDSIGDTGGDIVTAQFAVLTQGITSDQYAIVAGAQTLSQVGNGSGVVSTASFGINNNSSYETNTWAFYGEGHQINAAVGNTYGMELDVRTTVTSTFINPYVQKTQQVVALQLASGAGVSSVGQFPTSAAINIRANPMPFNGGIIFGPGSVANPGNNFPPAIQLPETYAISWWTGELQGLNAVNVSSTVATQANGTSLNFTDLGAAFYHTVSGDILVFMPVVAGAANHLQLAAGLAGFGVSLAALGTDTNIDLTLNPKGTGALNLGGVNAGSAGAIATYLDVKVNGVPYKLACYTP